jgi:hypothetical protein
MLPGAAVPQQNSAALTTGNLRARTSALKGGSNGGLKDFGINKAETPKRSPYNLRSLNLATNSTSTISASDDYLNHLQGHS